MQKHKRLTSSISCNGLTIISLLLKMRSNGELDAGTLRAQTRSAGWYNLSSCCRCCHQNEKQSTDRSYSQSIDIVICEETLLCAVELDGAVVVMLVPNSFDFLTGGGSQLVVDVDVDSPADVNVLHLYIVFVVSTNALTTLCRLVSSACTSSWCRSTYLLCTAAPSNWWIGSNGKFTNNVQRLNNTGWQNSSTQVPELQVRLQDVYTNCEYEYEYEYKYPKFLLELCSSTSTSTKYYISAIALIDLDSS